jgi:hypothetical protein
MKKRSVSIIALVLCSLFALSTTITLSTKTVQAANYAAVFLPNYYIQPYDRPGENAYSTQVCQWIISCLDNYYLVGYFWNQYTTPYHYAYAADVLDSSTTKGAFFSKGHASLGDSHGVSHHFLMGHDGENPDWWTWDGQHIYPYTSNGKIHFAFLWHCGTAEDYTGNLCPTCGKGVSFPFCYTRCGNMDYYGYYSNQGDYVFIGHLNHAHSFLDPTEYGPFNYGYFCAVVFQYLSYGYSVKQSLDFASQAAFGLTLFGQTPLYIGETLHERENCRMWVLGNGGIGISY